MTLREKKKQETKQRIFEAARNLFREKGYQDTTVDEITREAGVAKGTFFNYFPTKRALLIYFKEQKDRLVLETLEDQLGKNRPIADRIKDSLVLLAQNYEQDRELAQVMFFEHHRCPGKHGKRKDIHQRFLKLLCGLLQEGVDRAEIKKGIDIQLAARTLGAIYFHSLINWLHSDDQSLSGDISASIDLIFSGIGVHNVSDHSQ